VELAGGATARCWLGAALVASGRSREGADELLEGGGGPDLPRVDPWERPRWYGVLAEAELAQRRPNAAARWIERGEAAAAVAGQRAELQRVRAAWLLASGHPEEAVEAASQAADRLRRLGHAVSAARADVTAGRALYAAGRTVEGIERLEWARSALERAGARRHRDEAARDLRRLGRRATTRGRRADPATGVAGLSPRQRELAELVVAGHSNREIAADLMISEKTVEAHLSNMFRKLGVASRTALADAISRLPTAGT
jgi:DNA-binding NarL/FixJ family response regulator